MMRKKKTRSDHSSGSHAAGQARQQLKLAAIRYVNTQSAKRGRFAATFPTLEGRGVQQMHPRVTNVSFDVTQEVAAALRSLRDTGFYGSGVDCASVAEELLRRALLDPEIACHWRIPGKLAVARQPGRISTRRSNR